MPKSSKRNIKLSSSTAVAVVPASVPAVIPAASQAAPVTDALLARFQRIVSRQPNAYGLSNVLPTDAEYIAFLGRVARAAKSGAVVTLADIVKHGEACGAKREKSGLRIANGGRTIPVTDGGRRSRLFAHGCATHNDEHAITFAQFVVTPSAEQLKNPDVLRIHNAFTGKA